MVRFKAIVGLLRFQTWCLSPFERLKATLARIKVDLAIWLSGQVGLVVVPVYFAGTEGRSVPPTNVFHQLRNRPRSDGQSKAASATDNCIYVSGARSSELMPLRC